ncbi:divergent polysaccharide deacetylase family protein [Methylobacterium terricola]|uniref:Divergent polysaccharide deacetylase family protein n=1 Tax=Methylobacterium terricola TaxID=2583531 RepID=A0A5C4LNP6_9HYPH|nr:divergent polysaccharide deacetylase family protein [Methylobacterium terricola]TNC15101.1 divergent polysaccharide deacetylase family protein [Methylobacterium terricola]
MPLASDTILTRPLGLRDEATARTARWRSALTHRPLVGAALGIGALALGAVLVVGDDPLAGEPYAVATIAVRAPSAPVPEPAVPARPGPASRTADEVERASGVSVSRPDGTTAPDSVVIRVPPNAPVQLKPAPDPRLAERGRYGSLPKIGPDGARALDVYARPEAAGLERGGAVAGRIALVVSGLGIGQAATQDAIQRLPPAVTLAFAPYGADVTRSATRAREAGHEVMVQAPMEPFDYPDNDPGPQTLLTGAKPAENLDRLAFVLARVPGAVGVMNFMGARLTGEAAALEPVLREIGGRGLGFLDDGTSPRSLAREVGRKAKVPVARAEIVVDAVPRPDAIDRELARLEEAARKSGVVLASATALPLSIDRIARWARDLESRGILLVPASRAMRSGA